MATGPVTFLPKIQF